MSARDHALYRLDEHDFPNWPARTLRPGRLPELSERDADFCEQLYVGSVKQLLHLQWLIRHYSERTLKQIDAPVQKVMALALYQIRFLDKVPHGIAVDQAVEQVRRLKLGKADGFVNAVLRKATREPAPKPPAIGDNAHEYFEQALSFPYSMAQRLERIYGKNRTVEVAKHALAQAPVLLRLSEGVTAKTLLGEPFSTLGVELSAHETPGFLVCKNARRVTLGAWADAGVAQPQDPTSAMVVKELDCKEGMTVLDRCCGMGTKTLQMAAAVGPGGTVIAVDSASRRIDTLKAVLAARKITHVTAVNSPNVPEHPDMPKTYDRVLIDSPCSNSGVFSRREEAKYAQGPDAISRLVSIQQRLVADGLRRLKVGGLLVYATCSIWPEENESVAQAALMTQGVNSELLKQNVNLPAGHDDTSKWHDGGYFAVIRRTS